MLCRNIALGNGDETGKAGFGGHQIITIGIKLVLVDEIANRQKLALGIEKEAKFHGQRHGAGGIFNCLQALQELCIARQRFLGVAHVAVDGTMSGLRPEQQVRRLAARSRFRQGLDNCGDHFSLLGKGSQQVLARGGAGIGQAEAFGQRGKHLPRPRNFGRQAGRFEDGKIDCIDNARYMQVRIRHSGTPFGAGASQSNQMSGKIAAIDGR